MRDPVKLYRFLLKLYPARFREEYAKPLEQQFRDEYRETAGPGSRLAFWLRTGCDLATSVPSQVLREARQDIAFGVRTYARRPVVAVLALTALALSIGATTGVFSVVNALLLRSLPFREPERLVRIASPPFSPMSRTDVQHSRNNSNYLEDLVVFDSAEMNLLRGGEAVRVKVTETSANFFDMLGSNLRLGRAFAPDEDVPGKGALAVIGHGLWQQLFGGDPRALGSTIQLNGASVTVVGIAPAGFDFPARTAIWTPTTFDWKRIPKTRVVYWEALGRLKLGLTLAQARSMLEAEAKPLNRKSPKGFEASPKLIPLREELAGPVRQASQVLMGAVTFILLIACANVANLLLTRITERRHELVIRAALGATRSRLVQQLITEGLLLSILAAAAGVAVAHWVSRIASAAQPVQLAAQEYAVLDWNVLGFAVGLVVLTAFTLGVLPALLIARLHPAEDLIHAQPSGRHTGAGRLRRTLVVVQVSLTVALLAGSAVMGRAFLKLLGTDLGFDTDRVVTMSISLAGTRYEKGNLVGQYYDDVLERLRAVPGVEAAGGVDFLPLETTKYRGSSLKVEGGREVPVVVFIQATPDYFRAMGTPFLFGRDFTPADQQASEPVAIVNEEFAQLAGAGQDIVGRRVIGPAPQSIKSFKIVGVVRTVRYGGPVSAGRAQIYLTGSPDFMTFVARVGVDAKVHLAICRDAIKSVDRSVAVFDVRTLDDRLAENLAKPRFYTTAILFLGGFALLLAVIGIYAVASYAVAQRTQEIGVRIAVGASAGKVRLLLLRQSLQPVAIGIAAGIAGALALSRYIQNLLPTADQVDLMTSLFSAGLLVVICGVAIWSATQRVIELDPITVLRAE